VWLAASISIISMSLFSAKAVHISHFKQGLPLLGFKQFIVLANNLAVLVLPVHLGQHNK